MRLSDDQLAAIVQKATPVWHRVRLAGPPGRKSDVRLAATARLKRWCDLVADGNQESFERRLAWDNLTVEMLHDVLSGEWTNRGLGIPRWATLVQKAVNSIPDGASFQLIRESPLTRACINANTPLPFEEVFVPFVDVATNALIGVVPDLSAILSESALADLQFFLLESLAAIAGQTLELEFSLFRRCNESRLNRLLRLHDSVNTTTQYENFVEQMLNGGLIRFLCEYGVLARLLGTRTVLWIDVSAELLRRLHNDSSAIRHTFGISGPPGRVANIDLGRSDPHRGNRCVGVVQFECGLKIVYKPRNLGIDSAYQTLIEYVNKNGVPLTLKNPRVLNCSTHGWVEYIDHRPCCHSSEVHRFYLRAGMLLALFHVLNGTDVHAENLIAHGEYPIVVDLETLLTPEFRPASGSSSGSEEDPTLQMLFSRSVLGTGLLPHWDIGMNGCGFDGSGLGAVEGQQVPFPVATWENVNTDSMVLRYEFDAKSKGHNAPKFGGESSSADQYLDDILAGFSKMWQFLQDQSEGLLSKDGPLLPLARQKVRFVMRPTRLYGDLLRRTQHPKFLRDAGDRSVELDALAKALLTGESKPDYWAVLAAENAALEQMDIPYFCAQSSSTTLLAGDGHAAVDGFFAQSGFDRMVARLRSLSSDGLRRELGVIRGAFCSRIGRASHLQAKKDEPSSPNDIVSLSRDAKVGHAVKIGQELCQLAIRLTNGGVTWIALDYVWEIGRYQFQPVGYSLYGGVTGIALFLAGLEKAAPGNGFGDVAYAAVQTLRSRLKDKHSWPSLLGVKGIGGANGAGSIVYGLVCISKFLNDPRLLKDAERAAALVTSERIASDGDLDVVNGAAGAILGLASCIKQRPQAALVMKAIECGQHLLDARIKMNGDLTALKVTHDEIWCGFGHGAAGIALALVRLYEISGDVSFLKAAWEGICAETTRFVSSVGNWPAVTQQAGESIGSAFVANWCNGSAGIGLARLGCLSVLDREEMYSDVEAALNSVRRTGVQGVDHLCCGAFGRIEFLLKAGRQLGRPDLLELAERYTAAVVRRAEKTGAFRLFGNLPSGTYSPAFFQGMAGIGYELLRLACPDGFPSVLLWE